MKQQDVRYIVAHGAALPLTPCCPGRQEPSTAAQADSLDSTSRSNAVNARSRSDVATGLAEGKCSKMVQPRNHLSPQTLTVQQKRPVNSEGLAGAMAAGAGDHLMLSRLGLGEDNAESAGSSTVLVHENVVRVWNFVCECMRARPAPRACDAAVRAANAAR